MKESFTRSAKVKARAPLRPRSNPNRVRCYGAGIQPTGVLGAPNHFTVETFSAGQGKVEVFIQNPQGKLEPVDIKFNDDRRKIYTCTYTAKMEGAHKVCVKCNGVEVPRSPFSVAVEAGIGQLEIAIVDPKGKPNTVPIRDEEYRCKYVAQATRPHTVNVSSAGKQIPKSRFVVDISPTCDVGKVRASERGLKLSGVRVGDVADFKVITETGTPARLEIKVIAPVGPAKKVYIRKINYFTYECDYKPTKEGNCYVVMISFGYQEIFRGLFEVNIGPYKDSKIVAYGPGLRGGVANYPACFTVDTIVETGTLGFPIEGPSEAKIECKDNGDGSANVMYALMAPREYAIHVLSNGDDIPKSAYVAEILPKTDYYPEKVIAKGHGLKPNGVVKGSMSNFTIDASEASGHAPIDVSVMDENYKQLPLKMKENKDKKYNSEYKPENTDKHVVQVNYGGVAIPNSPFRVSVSLPSDASKLKIFGAGLEKGFGKINVSVKNEKGREIPFHLTENGNSTYSVDYTVPTPGNYKVMVIYVGKPIVVCPVTVSPHLMVVVCKVKMEILDSSIYINSLTDFTVNSRALHKKSKSQITCSITNPSGSKTDAVDEGINDGTYRVSYTPFEEGLHNISIYYDGQLVPGSSFKASVSSACYSNKVKANGSLLKRAVFSEKNQFTIETKGAVIADLGLSIEGPQKGEMTCSDNKDSTCTVEYLSTEVGSYHIDIMFAKKDIPGSPFKVPVGAPVNTSKVKSYGPGIEPKKCRVGPPLTFTVDAKKSLKAHLTVYVNSYKGPIPFKPEVVHNNDRTYDVSYIPPPEGRQCNVKVVYAHKDVPGSPFKMKVKPITEQQNLKLSGSGVGKSIPASIPTEFTIDAKDAGYGTPEVVVESSDGSKCKTKIVNNKDGTYKVRYTTHEVGQHKVNVKFGRKEISCSPFFVNSVVSGNADKCKISHILKEKLEAGEKYCITVNAQDAGKGAVTCRVTNKNKESSKSKKQSKKVVEEEEEEEEEEITKVRVVDYKDGTYNIYYKVVEDGEYEMNIRYGGQQIKEGCYKFRATKQEVKSGKTIIKEESTTYEEVTTSTNYRQVQLLNVPAPPSLPQNTVVAFLKMPSRSSDKATIIDNYYGTVSIKYDPKEGGLDELHIKYNNEHIQGSPFKFHADNTSSGYVTAADTVLMHGIAGEPCPFTIHTKGTGVGGLNVSVQGPSKAEITCNDDRDGTVKVCYLYLAPGDYKVVVRFAGKDIKVSPSRAKVTGESRRRTHLSVGHASEVSLTVQEKDVKSLNASIVSPTGLEEPCFLKKLANNQIGVSFTPREAGEHMVNVKRESNHINGSLFRINVLEREVGDASKVKVIGNAVKEGKTHSENLFSIDTKDAGFGGLSLSIEGPSKAEIQCKDNGDSTMAVSYKPTEPGYYIINLKFVDHHVPGSPFTVKVTGQGSNVQRENIKKQRDAVSVSEVGSECKLMFKMPETSGLMTAKVFAPSGFSDDAEIMDLDDSLYCVKFVPKESYSQCSPQRSAYSWLTFSIHCRTFARIRRTPRSRRWSWT